MPNLDGFDVIHSKSYHGLFRNGLFYRYWLNSVGGNDVCLLVEPAHLLPLEATTFCEQVGVGGVRCRPSSSGNRRRGNPRAIDPEFAQPCESLPLAHPIPGGLPQG
jgi:hypothetical protein